VPTGAGCRRAGGIGCQLAQKKAAPVANLAPRGEAERRGPGSIASRQTSSEPEAEAAPVLVNGSLTARRQGSVIVTPPTASPPTRSRGRAATWQRPVRRRSSDMPDT
jgi:hypothetical protein